MEKINSPEEYIERHEAWKNLLTDLREALFATGLEEKMKWSIPTYCVDNKNVVGLAAFKEYCGLWFFYGSILEDPLQVLQNTQEKTKHMRHWKFYPGDKIPKAAIVQYVIEAAEKVDLAPKPAKAKKAEVPALLKETLAKDPALKAKFSALTPFKQKEYCEHIAGAKQEKTKLSRLEKIIPMISAGIGLHDKYRNC